MSKRTFEVLNYQLLIQISLAESKWEVIRLMEKQQELRKEYSGRV